MTDGIVLYDKPGGMTSHDVVAAMRGALRRDAGGAHGVEGSAQGRVKVGHAGTLDPFASGLLLILLGRATRAQRFLMQLPKRYEAVARFGAVSSTGDPEGEIVETGVIPEGDLDLPLGRIRQRPPAYSAIKVSGRRAYALARAGVADLELPEREVSIHRFEELFRRGEQRGFVIECSSGTYIRSLIADLGDAYCQELRRTRIGPFDVRDADPERTIELRDALSFLPEVRLRDEDARRASHGAAVRAAGPAGESIVRLTSELELIALAEPCGEGVLKPVAVLAKPGITGA